MFNSFFIHTRTSLDRIKRQLLLLSRSFSITTQLIFIGYYIYLIFTNIEKLPFLIVYACMLTLSVCILVIEFIYIFSKRETRLEKRIALENKRKASLIGQIIKTALKLAVICLSAYEIYAFGATNFQIITFVIMIMFFLVNIVVNILTNIILQDIDVIRLSFEMDVQKSRILSKLMGEKEYSEQEHRIIDRIEEKTERFREKKEAFKSRVKSLFKKDK